MLLRVVGDVHGNYRAYRKIIKGRDQTLQVGDMGFEYLALGDLDPEKHRFFGGNHDNYDIVEEIPHYLKDFGVWESVVGPVFFIRGAWSIDHRWREEYFIRTGQKIHWEQEEMTVPELQRVIDLYCELKPPLVISHACPQGVIKHVTDREFQAHFGFSTDHELMSRTGLAMQAMFEKHQPKLWIFGHYHTSRVWTENGTKFICLNMCPEQGWYVDINADLEVEGNGN